MLNDNKQKKGIVKVGIMPLEQFKARTLAIAKGDYKPTSNEPKIWFNSIKSLANILSEENQALLRAIDERHPHSVTELSQMVGRKPNNVIRTLRTMEKYGFVRLRQEKPRRGRAPLVPEVVYKAISIDINFNGYTPI